MGTAAPYRTPDPGVIRPGPWTLVGDGEPRPLPDVLEAWDHATELRLERLVEIDAQALREQTGLGKAELVIAANWRCRPSELRGRGAARPLGGGDAESATLEVTLSGSMLSGTLVLETVVHLAERGGAHEGRVAWRAGSVLWRDSVTCRLQGDAALFPIAVVDFDALGYDDRAPWFLQIGGDLTAPAAGALQLLVNKRATRVVEALEHASSPDPAQEVVLSTLRYDVARTLADYALAHPEMPSDEPFEIETLGDVLTRLLSTAFPRSDLKALRASREGDVPRWAADVASAFGLFRERAAS